MRLGREAKVVIEATTNTWAAVRLLKPHVGEVVVSNPLLTKAIAQAKIKTDKVDALVLARASALRFLAAGLGAGRGHARVAAVVRPAVGVGRRSHGGEESIALGVGAAAAVAAE